MARGAARPVRRPTRGRRRRTWPRPSGRDGRPRWFPPEFDWVVGCSYTGLPETVAPVRNLIGAAMSFRRQHLRPTRLVRHRDGPAGRPAARVRGDRVRDPNSTEHRGSRARACSAREGPPPYRARPRAPRLLPPPLLFGGDLEGRRHTASRRRPGAFHRAAVRSLDPAQRRRRRLRDGLRGDPGGFARAAMIVFGLAVTTAGYLVGSGSFRPAPERAA